MPGDSEWLTWTDSDFAGLRDLIEVWEKHREEFAQQAPSGGSAAPQGGRGGPSEATGGASRAEAAERNRATLDMLHMAIETRSMDGFYEMVERIVPQIAYQGLTFEQAMQQLARSSGPIAAMLAQDLGKDSARFAQALQAFIKLKDGLAVHAGEAFAHQRAQQAEDEQKKVIRELSTPVVQVWDGILVMPLVGVVDSRRAKQMMERLLQRITSLGSEVVILDVTGVPTVDSEVANHFVRTMQAARLVGAATILVGISPQVAQALVRLNVSFPGLDTYADLRSGLRRAFALIGQRVVPAGAGEAAAWGAGADAASGAVAGSGAAAAGGGRPVREGSGS